MGIGTPDLLHALEQRSVHRSPLPFSTDTADQPIRPPQSAAVHDSSLRMVTSLVTSHPGNAAPARQTRPDTWPSARPDSACTQATRALRAFHQRRARSARTRAAAPEPWRTASRAAAAGKRPPGLREPDAVPAPPRGVSPPARCRPPVPPPVPDGPEEPVTAPPEHPRARPRGPPDRGRDGRQAGTQRLASRGPARPPPAAARGPPPPPATAGVRGPGRRWSCAAAAIAFWRGRAGIGELTGFGQVK